MSTTPDPPWLATMRSLIGTEWSPSDGPSPTINEWLQFISSTYPDMANYCASVSNGNYFSWCGMTVGYCMAKAGVMPVFGATDTTRFLWAMAWLGWGTPVLVPEPGDVLVFDFGGGDHHVTLFDSDNGNGTWSCLGGNQTHAVKSSNFKKSSLMGIRRPPAVGAVVQQAPAGELQMGAMGAAVSGLQQTLGIAVDGEFGLDTDSAVRAFQASHGLDVDGVVGPDTRAALLLVAAPIGAVQAAPLIPAMIGQIIALARSSALARVSWHDRGVAPIGYINGVAVTFARVYLKLKAGDPAALAMTVPIGGPGTDALAWYGFPGGDRPALLRQLFVLLYGLGMRESSGRCFEGRDTSASNVSADTAEAGLFQQSWNSRSASPQLPRLFAAYFANPDGFLPIFREGVAGSPSPNVGSGDGAAFQALCKSCPAFAVEAAAVGLRVIRAHWGPIIRREAEVRSEADSLLQQVQSLVDAAAPLVVTIPPTPQPGAPPVANQIDINALLAAIQPQIQALIVQAVQQAMGALPIASVPAPLPPLIIAPPTAPAPAITVSSTIAHIQPVLDMINAALAGMLPPPYDLIPKALGAAGHLIAASSGNAQATPASIGQAINDLTQAGLGGLHAGGANLPPWLQGIVTALHPPALDAAPKKGATTP